MYVGRSDHRVTIKGEDLTPLKLLKKASLIG
jgi:hypothetical protein